MEKKREYVSLQEAAEKFCEYSQEYLSLRARQGKLKAIKIGRNWATKKEWLEEYLNSFNNKKEEYISFQEAAEKFCEYSQEYLSLRARQGKLKAIKIGRNWATKKEWLEEYLNNFNNKNGKKIVSEKKEKVIPKHQKINPVLQEKFSFPILKQFLNPSRKFSIPLVKHRPIFVKEFLPEKKRKLFTPKFISVVAEVLLLIFLIGGIFFVFQELKINNYFKNNLADFSYNTYLIFQNLDLRDAQAANFQVFKEYGEWLLVSVKNLPKNISGAYRKADKFVENKLKETYRSLLDILKPEKEIVEEKNIFSEEEIAENLKEQSKKGMVVLPYEGEEKKEKVIEKIKSSFSDEVRVEQKDESSGIITPIFREEKEGDKYFYVLVPLKD